MQHAEREYREELTASHVHSVSRPTSSSAASSGPVKIIIRGRCIAAESGKPLAGCEVFLLPSPHDWGFPMYTSKTGPVFGRPMDHELVGFERATARREFSAYIGEISVGPQHEYQPRGKSFPDLALDRHFMTAEQLAKARAGGKLYQRLPNAVSGEDGCFELRTEAYVGAASGPGLEVASAHRCPRSCWSVCAAVNTTKRVALGDIPMHLGVRVSGSVRDQDGAPIPGATVYLEGLPHAIPDRADRVFTSSYSEGRFAFESPVPPGTYELTIRAVGAQLVGPKTITVGSFPRDVRIKMRTRPSSSGVLVDVSGQPVSGTILFGTRDGKVHGAAVTDKQGRFRMRQKHASSPPVHLVTAYHYDELVDPPPPVAWGTKKLRLVARPTQPAELHVVHGVTGKPVAASVIVFTRWLGMGSGKDLEETDHFFAHESHKGRLMLKNVRTGRHRFRLQLNDGDWLVRTTVEATLPYGSERRPITVKMFPAVGLTVLVTNAGGKPESHAYVEMAKCGTWDKKRKGHAHGDGVIGHGRTNSEGEVRLWGAAPGTEVDLHVAGEKVVRKVRVWHGMPPVRVRL